jgi:hypothetical protein
MSILTDFRTTMENTSPLNIYLEYDSTPLEDRGVSFVTLGINSEESAYDIQTATENFTKDRIVFNVRVIMRNDTTSNTISNYFDTYILNPLMRTTDFNITSVKKGTPAYTKYLDRMELLSTITVECINYFEDEEV